MAPIGLAHAQSYQFDSNSAMDGVARMSEFSPRAKDESLPYISSFAPSSEPLVSRTVQAAGGTDLTDGGSSMVAGMAVPMDGEISQSNAPTPLQGAFCDECPTWSVATFVGYDSWRGITDDSWQNNGIVVGGNFGTRLGEFSDLTGFGLQAGGSVGVFDWAGTDYRPSDRNSAETQGFVTYGLFRKPTEASKWSATIVQDWMFNNNYGVFSQNPTLSQLRGQLGYAFSATDELGLWGTVRVLNDSRLIAGQGMTTWRAIDQLNLYWHHKWQLAGADTVIWIGMPERDRLNASGSLGDYIAGASANVPLNDRFALYTLVTYMHPSAGAGPAGSEEEQWNFTIGVSFYPRGNARSTTVAGQCWTPQLPVANNGYFFVDTNHH
jgi:hypothetical protein